MTLHAASRKAEARSVIARQMRLPYAVKRYEDLRSLIGGSLTAGLAWALALPLVPGPWDVRVATAVSALAAVVVVLDVLLFNRRLYRFFSASTADGVLTIHTGRLLPTDSTIRGDAVLSVDVTTGPILRRWGLARVKLNGIATFPDLPPLEHGDALAIQDALTRGSSRAGTGME